MPIKQIYLHVGLGKTGSTTIQQTMFLHRDELSERGITYWDFTANHSRPLKLAFDVTASAKPAPDDVERPQSKSSRRMRALEQSTVERYGSAETIKNHLRSALGQGQAKFVISAEGISNWNLRSLTAFKSFLEQSCPRIKVIAYVRDPVPLYHSRVQQFLKGGRPLSRLAEVDMEYRARIEPFFLEFGRENVVLRRFGSAYFHNGDLMGDFFSTLDEPPSLAAKFPATKHQNTSLSHRAAMVLDALNRADTSKSDAGLHAWVVGRYLRPLFPGSPFRAPAEWVNDMLARNAADIEWMSAQLGVELSTEITEQDAPVQTNDSDLTDDLAKLASALRADMTKLRRTKNDRRERSPDAKPLGRPEDVTAESHRPHDSGKSVASGNPHTFSLG